MPFDSNINTAAGEKLPSSEAEPLDAKALTRFIREEAQAMGFQKVGILPATALTEEAQHLQAWLDAGKHGEMTWMANHLDKRLDPAGLMPGTRSIVCVAMNYYTPDVPNPHLDAVKIAKYARGTDYHRVLKDRLKLLLRRIQGQAPTVTGRALTDSAPILEKALAVRAGIGWQGKHSNVITPDYGSWLFLGELLLDIDLVYDETPLPDRCGTCTRCIDACPTDAIVDPAVVDATRCLSYWTIEYKGDAIPPEIAARMDGWVFGCDICQDVCPWNVKFAQETLEPLFQARPWNQSPTAEALLTLSEDAFQERYRQSPLKRTKLTGLQRNVAAWQGATTGLKKH